MQSIRQTYLVFSLALGVAALPQLSLAADIIEIEPPAPTAEPGPVWDATIVPFYSWLPGFDGTIGTFGIEASVDITVGDLIQNLDELLHAVDGIYFGTGHIRYGNFGLLYDVAYLDVSSANQFAGETTRSATVSGLGPIGGSDLTISGTAAIEGVADASFSYTAVNLAGTYRFYETPTTQLDAVLGARWTDVDLSLGIVADASLVASLDLNTNLGNLSRVTTSGDQINAVISDGSHWVDAIAGIAGRHSFTENWYVNGWALAGGGGSDYVYDVMAGLGYEWDGRWSLYGGWRVVGTEYSNDTFVWDVVMSGPTLGLSVKF